MKKIYTLLFIFSLTISFANAQWVTIPDANFAAFLQQQYPQCMNGNQMDTTCSAIVNAIKLDCTNKSIANLHGIQFFDNLDTLSCNQNQLTSLPALPQSLILLSCAYNQLYSLPDLPVTLVSLFCGYNNLTWLPSLPTSLTYLNCRDNDLITLPTLPNNLINLLCGNNNLISIPSIPGSLKELACFGNQLTSIPTLPNGLIELFCAYNSITSIPNLPSSMIALYAHYNEISSLPPFPNGIKSIFLQNNQLTTIPTLPDTIYDLDVRNNPDLLCLPEIKNIIGYVKLTGTGVQCAPNNPNLLFPFSYIEPSLDTFPLCNTFNPDNCPFFTDIFENTALRSTINIYPNPSTENITIDFSLKGKSLITIDLYDIKGQFLESIADIKYASEDKSISYSMSKFSSGVYYIKATINDTREIRKIIKY